MKRHIVFAAALAAMLSPLAVLAQGAPPPPDGAPQGPPPEMRAQFEQLRTQYKTAVLNDLSADHRAKVQAILAQVQSGSLDPRDASGQIDGILSPSETQAVLGEAQKLHAAMQKAMAQAQAQAQHHRGMAGHKPDAGRFLMMLSMPPRPPMMP